ncbi:MAG: acyloxyacyl hydrolase [Bacteroidales bacterium]|nr:acyloxyacyl hydrolase [Bacteroidales bacterium]
MRAKNLFLIKLIGFIFLLLIKDLAFSQNKTGNPLLIGIKTHIGFIIPHSEDIRSISNSNPWAIETEFSQIKTDDKTYQLCFCYPKTGVSLLYINFDNPEILGNGYAFIPFIEPYFNFQKKLRLSLKAGTGPVFHDNPYNEVTNPQNLFYSTKFSFILILNFRLNYLIKKNVNLNISANYNHISNGSVKQPNKGINFPTTSVGIDYIIKPVEFVSKNKISLDELYPKKIYYKVSVFYTTKEMSGNKNKFSVFGTSGNICKIIGRISALTAGVDLLSDYSVLERINNDKTGAYGSDHKSLSLLAGHELLMGRFVFSTEFGLYLYKHYDTRDEFYQRYGLKYKINEIIFIGVNLKAHRHVADFLDFRIGIILK